MKVSRNAHRDEHTICEKLYGRVGFVFFRKPVFFIVVFLSIYYLFIYLFIIYLFICYLSIYFWGERWVGRNP